MNRVPRRVQRRRYKGWRMPDNAIYVGHPTKWGNPFRLRSQSGLVRYRPATPEVIDYEHRISGDGQRHDWYDEHGELVEHRVRYATRTEIVWLHRRALTVPTPGMIAALPPGGRLVKVTVAEVRAELAGRDLACWCSLVDDLVDGPQPCHADVLLEVANG